MAGGVGDGTESGGGGRGRSIRLTSSLVPGREAIVDASDGAVSGYRTRYRAGIWDDVVDVADVGDEAAGFVADVIAAAAVGGGGEGGGVQPSECDGGGIRVASVLPGGATVRPLDGRYLPPAALTSLGSVPSTSLNDGFSILIASESSLAELNRRLIERGKDPVPMSRFRPNLVIAGTRPFEEDTWRAVRIGGAGGAILHVVKGCPRCRQSCTDQITGERYDEPLETLATFRALNSRNPTDVYFGQNAVPQVGWGKSSAAVIRVGDRLEVLTRGEPVWDTDAVRAE